MATKDISRFLHQPKKRYSGVRMQQGRVILDSDWNESERLDDEEARKVRLDILGPKGTADDGFRIGTPLPENSYAEVVESPPAPTPHYKVGWTEGSYYIGGVRFEAHEPDEDLLAQQDFDRINNLVGELPDTPTADRNDLVYLEGWEQCVTATEDRELQEVALGGPDTSVRVRRMRRVRVKTGVSSTSCPTAFGELTTELEGPQSQSATFDAASCELESNARLTVGFGSEPFMDPCAPASVAGYAGAENDAIRVQLVSETELVWGRDNASLMFKASVSSDGTTLTFQTLPRDQASQPLARQAIEILAPGSVLSNGERVAELVGEIHEIQQSYDPDDQTVTLATPVTADLRAWLTEGFVYARLWTGGPAATFTPGVPYDLAGTNLTAQIDSPGLEGDYWVIAARPNAPEEVVPWTLKTGEPPMGPRRFYAPLAIVEWLAGVVDSVHDCRSIIDPLAGDKRTAKIIVGNALNGDTLEVCDFLDPGDGTGIEAGLAAASSGSDVFIRAGVYDLQNHPTYAAPFAVSCNVQGAGGETIILSRSTGDQGVFSLALTSKLSNVTIHVQAPAGTMDGSTAVVSLAKAAVANDVRVFFMVMTDLQAMQMHLTEAFRFSSSSPIDLESGRCVGCTVDEAPLLSVQTTQGILVGFVDDGGGSVTRFGPQVVNCFVRGSDIGVRFTDVNGGVVSNFVAENYGLAGVHFENSSKTCVDGARLRADVSASTTAVRGVLVEAKSATVSHVSIRGVYAEVSAPQVFSKGVELVGGMSLSKSVVTGCTISGFDTSYELGPNTATCAVVANTGDSSPVVVDLSSPPTNDTTGTI